MKRIFLSILSVQLILLILVACQPVETAYIIDASETEVPTATPRPTRPTPTALIQGSLQIGNGGGITGGTAGEMMKIVVSFEAASPVGTIEEMRVRTSFGGCYTESEMGGSAWEPFLSTKSFEILVANNWLGFYVTVQYRDSVGNISLAFCEEISIEGLSPMPTTTPTLSP